MTAAFVSLPRPSYMQSGYLQLKQSSLHGGAVFFFMALSFVFISFVSIYAVFVFYSAQPGASLKKATSFTIVHVLPLPLLLRKSHTNRFLHFQQDMSHFPMYILQYFYQSVMIKNIHKSYKFYPSLSSLSTLSCASQSEFSITHRAIFNPTPYPFIPNIRVRIIRPISIYHLPVFHSLSLTF